MATVRDEYGFEFEADHFTLDDTTLARIRYVAKVEKDKCRGISDYAHAFHELELAARNLIALRHLQDRVNGEPR